ncbi:hypothetical protein BV22DRAFT_1122186 [Leucogyrophana mollusca]|uniref:Uncharacterized protein n=1 Tax=Leucogyrophana mollusca TaxID=85980 RepID=A0ACB8B876_9AGAM|nr:hypothetical protein BV22DRAFT_1122186 [Leucogyrophana mollusca]
MSTAGKDNRKPIFRRLSQVYVEIPPSPLHTARKNGSKQSASLIVTSGHKENALLYSDGSHMSSASTSPKKRKMDCDISQPSAKKQKPAPLQAAELEKPVNSSEEYPNGFFYCHQCNRKRDTAACIRCTVVDVKDRRCAAKYCKACLKNRYGLSLDDIKTQGGAESAKNQTKHIAGEGYLFKCPRCDDACNCVKCRKAKGLEPTGNLTLAARQSGANSAAEVLRADIKATGPMRSKSTSVKVDMKTKAARKSTSALSSEKRVTPRTTPKQTSSSVPPKKKAEAPPKVKPVPKPTWSCIDIPLSLSEVEERIHIREFALRFGSLLDIPRPQLEELEEIRGSRGRGSEDDDDDLVPWVSEPCVKSLILGLLQVLDVDREAEKPLKTAIKHIRDSGGNLNKIWSALSALRDHCHDLSSSSSTSSASPEPPSGLIFPDPLPPPSSAPVIRTRSGISAGLTVVRTAQLVPVIAALVDAAVESEDVRTELDTGVREAKEQAKEAREASRVENERYEKEKEDNKAKEKKDKLAVENHKRVLSDIEDALKVSSYAYIPRVCPLGRDTDGRVYWALSPGINEREAAAEMLSMGPNGGSSRSRRNRKRLVAPPDERSALKKWSWFIAVWGMRPPVEDRAVVRGGDSDDEEEEEEQWWGFWDPEEITKLAAWVSAKSGIDVETSTPGSRASTPVDPDSEDEADARPTKEQTKALVKDLGQYAALLRWRVKREDE